MTLTQQNQYEGGIFEYYRPDLLVAFRISTVRCVLFEVNNVRRIECTNFDSGTKSDNYTRMIEM